MPSTENIFETKLGFCGTESLILKSADFKQTFVKNHLYFAFPPT